MPTLMLGARGFLPQSGPGCGRLFISHRQPLPLASAWSGVRMLVWAEVPEVAAGAAAPEGVGADTPVAGHRCGRLPCDQFFAVARCRRCRQRWRPPRGSLGICRLLASPPVTSTDARHHVKVVCCRRAWVRGGLSPQVSGGRTRIISTRHRCSKRKNARAGRGHAVRLFLSRNGPLLRARADGPAVRGKSVAAKHLRCGRWSQTTRRV